MTYRLKVAAAVFRQPDRGPSQRLAVDRAERSRSGLLPNDAHREFARNEQTAQRGNPAQQVVGRLSATTPESRLVAHALGIVAIVALSFLIELTVLGNLRHDRDQTRLAAQFRDELANAVAPVGPLDDANKPLATGTPVALLEIPTLGVREVVGEGTSSGTLMSGPGHRRDTPLPGQVGTSVIAGRRATYGGPFRNISQLHAGDQITVITGQGKHSFRVLDVRRAGDPLPLPLSAGQGRLTLVTTDGPALAPTDVLRVDAALVSAVQARPAQLASQLLPPADALMAGDDSVLFSVVGWSLLLVAAAIGAVWVRFRTGLWQAWVISLPILVTLNLTVFDEIAAMLPNLL